MSEEKKKTSIKIDPELWKEIKIEAIRREMDISEFVEQTLRKELKLKGELSEPRRRV
jgi:predicted HicB family RNase H-like nuclease